MMAAIYDPVKAHEYYVRTRKLKGRKKAGEKAVSGLLSSVGATATGQKKQGHAQQKARLDKQIGDLRTRLTKLNAELKKRMAESSKPDTAAEKADAARSSKEWRAKNQQKVKSQNEKKAKEAAKASPSSSGGSKTKSGGSNSVEDLKGTIKKVRDQLSAAVARRRALG